MDEPKWENIARHGVRFQRKIRRGVAPTRAGIYTAERAALRCEEFMPQ
ncbi:MAG: hypothetical protein CM15mV106_400 [uncultured marine virus]|nr:MAG: hypothetical protein CM15mV106_400 [uncultured marine virus]